MRGWAGLACFNKLKENTAKGIFQKNTLTERPRSWCLGSRIVPQLCYCRRSLVGTTSLRKDEDYSELHVNLLWTPAFWLRMYT